MSRSPLPLHTLSTANLCMHLIHRDADGSRDPGPRKQAVVNPRDIPSELPGPVAGGGDKEWAGVFVPGGGVTPHLS